MLGVKIMATVYIEARPKGGGPIQDYVVEDHADHVLGTFKTQHDAIDWAKKERPFSARCAGPTSKR